jgi:hypothetical protein
MNFTKMLINLAVLGAVAGAFFALPSATRSFVVVAFVALHILRLTGAKT